MKPLLSTTATATRMPVVPFLTTIASLFGVIVLTEPMISVARAVELPRSRLDQIAPQPSNNVSQEKPTAVIDASRQPTSPMEAPKQPISERMQQDGQVSITDVPLECQAYFLGKRSISLFDYQQGVERCRYGSR